MRVIAPVKPLLKSGRALALMAGALLYSCSAFAAQEAPFKTLSGHAGGVWAVAFSSDGKYLASAGQDSAVIIWDAASFSQLKALRRHTKPVTSLSFSPNGKYLASAARDNSVVIWRTDIMDAAVTVKAHTKSVLAAAFSPDGKYLASAGMDGTVRVFRSIIFRPVNVITETAKPFCIAFSPDSQLLAAGGEDGALRLYDGRTFKLVKSAAAQPDYVWAAAFSPDGKYLATAGRDGSVRVWAMPDLTLAASMPGDGKPVAALAFSPDGKYLASAGEGKIVTLWLAGDFKPALTLPGHEAAVGALAFSPDGRYLVSGGEDKTVRVWQVPTPAQLAHQPPAPAAAAPQPKKTEEPDPSRKNIDEGNRLLTFSALELKSNSAAREQFRQALSIKESAEARDGFNRADRMVRKGYTLAGEAAGGLLLALGAAIFALLRRRKKAAPDKAASGDKIQKLLASGKAGAALKAWREYAASGGDPAEIAEETLFGLFDKNSVWDSLEKDALPAKYCCAFSRKLLAAGNMGAAWLMFSKFRAGYSEPYIPALISEEETLKLYASSPSPAAIDKEPISPAGAAAYGAQLAAYGKKDDAAAVLLRKQVLCADIPAEAAKGAVSTLVALGKEGELLKLLESEKCAQAVYSAAASAFASSGKNENTAKVLEFLSGKHGALAQGDAETLVAACKTLDSLDNIRLELIPPAARAELAQALFDADKPAAALKALSSGGRGTWGDSEYALCVQLYSKLDMYDLAEEMATSLPPEKDAGVLPEFYYSLAEYAERQGKPLRALEIYKQFAAKGLDFKDVVTRYPALRDKLAEQGIRLTRPPVREEAALPEAAAPPQPAAEAKPEAAPRSGKKRNADEDTRRVALLKGGKMELIKEIGRGGMGIVYSVFDKTLNRKAALKRMREELYISGKESDKFLNEARMAAQLSHPNIVVVYEIIEHEEMAYILFEYIDGQSLQQVLESSPSGMRYNEALRIVEQVCNGLSYAHNHNVIHRDLKPSNIMLAKDGLVKITDFGIARTAKDTIMRLTGASTGTLAYMSPEQELGSCDVRSDIYSLGVMMYEMLTGDLPFRGPNFYLQKEKMVFSPPSEIAPELPRDIDAVIAKCLDADRSKRYGSVDELLRELVGRL